MPFKSEAQRKLCYLLKEQGKNGTWDCDEWDKETKGKTLIGHIGDKDKPSDKDEVKPIGTSVKDKLTDTVKLARAWAKMATEGEGSTVIDQDPTEGLAKVTTTVKPVNKKIPVAIARKALRGASRKVLGVDPTGGQKYASVISKLAEVFKAPAPTGTPAAGQPPALNQSQAANPVAAPIAKPQPPSQTWSALGGAGTTAQDTFGALMGNEGAMENLRRASKLPNYSQLQTNMESLGTSFGPTLNRWGNAAVRTGNQLTAFMEDRLRDSAKARIENDPAEKARYIKGYTLGGFNHDAGVNATNTGKALNNVRNGINSMKDTAKAMYGAVAPKVQQAYDHAKEQAAVSEGQRMTAQYAYPVVKWMNENPWSKWLLGAGALGLGAYGLSGMFGGGQQGPNAGAQIQGAFQQGMNQGRMGYGR